MKAMRLLGDRIAMLAQRDHLKKEDIAEILRCQPSQVALAYKGRAFLSLPQLEKLAQQFHTTIEDLLAGDEKHYEESFVHCMGAFEVPENRECMLDILDDYLSLLDAVALPVE